MLFRRFCSAASQQSEAFFQKSEGYRKVYSEDAECFFQGVLTLYIPMFLKNSAASLMELPELHLGLPKLRSSLLGLH